MRPVYSPRFGKGLASRNSIRHLEPVTIDRQARAVAVRQGGVILRSQALRIGYSVEQVRNRLEKGDWTRVTDGAYRVLDLREPGHLIRAAVAVLPGAVVSHQSAAQVHGLPRVARGLAVVTVHASTTHALEGVTVHRTRDLASDHIESTGNLPVTTAARTIVDLAAVLDRRHLAGVIDESLSARLLDLDRLVATFEEVGRRGKKGTAALRDILAERRGGPASPASAMERRARGLLHTAGLPEPRIEYPVPWSPGKRFDMAYPDLMIAIEWDSRRWHARFEDFERDRRRDRDAVMHGWVVLRFTWEDLRHSPHDVVRVIREMVRRRMAPNSGL